MQLQAKYLLLCLFVGLFASYRCQGGAEGGVTKGEGKKDCHNEIHSTAYASVCVSDVCMCAHEHFICKCMCTSVNVLEFLNATLVHTVAHSLFDPTIL